MTHDDFRMQLTAYLDGELPPDDRAQLQRHLETCAECRRELDALAVTRRALSQSLRHWADVEPAPQAWARLEAALAEAPTTHRTPFRGLARSLKGDRLMQRPILMTGALAALVIALFLGAVARPSASVSARAILDRAQAAQSATPAVNDGIRHLANEMYRNNALLMPGLTDLPAETKTTVESYYDPSNGWGRLVVADALSGKVTEVTGYDGTYIYKGEPDESGAVTTVYRSRRTAGMVDQWETYGAAPVQDTQQLFDDMKSDPDVTLVGQDTWTDGRAVYVLRSSQVFGTKLMPGQTAPKGSTLITFDAQTYALIAQRSTVTVDGKDVLAYAYTVLADEVLPRTAPVPWNLSDLKSVTLVDDPNGEHVDLLPEPITQDELVRRAGPVLMLSAVPDGFTLHITAAPNETPLVDYFIDYRAVDGRYLMIQGGGSPDQVDASAERITTAGGLTLAFKPEPSGSDANEPEFMSGVITPPSGPSFMLASNLPRAQVLDLVAQLVEVR